VVAAQPLDICSADPATLDDDGADGPAGLGLLTERLAELVRRDEAEAEEE
jgi:hypothetical protein